MSQATPGEEGYKKSLEHVRFGPDTQGGYCKAKEKALDALNIAYVIRMTQTWQTWKPFAKEALYAPPYKMYDTEKHTDAAIIACNAQSEKRAKSMMTRPEVVGLQIVYLDQRQIAAVEAEITGTTAFQQFKKLQNLAFPRGDVQTILIFKAEYQAALRDGAACEKDVATWVDTCYHKWMKVMSAMSEADEEKNTSSAQFRDELIFNIPKTYKDVKNVLKLQAKFSKKDGAITVSDVTEALLEAERTRRVEDVTSGSDEEKDGQPSAQASFSERQDYSGNGGYRGGRGRGGRGGRGGGGRTRGGGRGERGDRDKPRRCHVCGSVEHLSWGCPDRWQGDGDEES
jgi:hypothetical protein